MEKELKSEKNLKEKKEAIIRNLEAHNAYSLTKNIYIQKRAYEGGRKQIGDIQWNENKLWWYAIIVSKSYLK